MDVWAEIFSAKIFSAKKQEDLKSFVGEIVLFALKYKGFV